ncbi:LPS-assembly protein LptD [Pseudomonadota bacterium]
MSRPGITKALLPLLLLPFQLASPAMAGDWGLCTAWPEPQLNYPGEEKGEDSATYLGADSSVSNNNEVVTLTGNVLMERPGEQLSADNAVYNKLSGTLLAEGNIRYETADFAAVGDNIDLKLNSDQGQFMDTEYFVFSRHARGSSRKILLDSNDSTVLKSASYTTCDPGDEDWSLRATTVKLDHDAGMGSAFNARLIFKRVPFFYLPYIRFPINDQRVTGILPPSWGSTSQGGNEFILPIYINIHPQLDATFTAHNYTNRGMKRNIEYRYLSIFGQGIINTERLNDEVYGGERSLYKYTHTGEVYPDWDIDILFSKVSDQEYFNDFSNSLSTSSVTHLERYVKLSHSDAYGSLQIQAQDYFTIDTSVAESSRPYRRLPQVTYNITPLEYGPAIFSLESEAVRFQRQDLITSKRLHAEPSITFPYEGVAGFIKPKLALHYTRYELNDEFNTQEIEKLRRSVPYHSVDAGIFLERDTTFFKTDYLHTLEPRLFYLNVPYRNQSDFPLFDSGLSGFSSAQLFSENRFSGFDRVGDTKQVSLSVTSRLIRNKDGHELLSGTAGQIYYLKDREVGLSGNTLEQSTKTDAILEGELRPNKRLKLSADFLWSPEYDTITHRDFRIQYLSDNNHIFNLAYRENGNRVTSPDSITQEIDSSIMWSLNPRWSIIGRRYHSLLDNRTTEKLFGFEYNDCCWTFRALRRAAFVADADATEAPFGTLRYSWNLQLELKGLASLGKRINELMEEQVYGYTDTN